MNTRENLTHQNSAKFSVNILDFSKQTQETNIRATTNTEHIRFEIKFYTPDHKFGSPIKATKVFSKINVKFC